MDIRPPKGCAPIPTGVVLDIHQRFDPVGGVVRGTLQTMLLDQFVGGVGYYESL